MTLEWVWLEYAKELGCKADSSALRWRSTRKCIGLWLDGRSPRLSGFVFISSKSRARVYQLRLCMTRRLGIGIQAFRSLFIGRYLDVFGRSPCMWDSRIFLRLFHLEFSAILAFSYWSWYAWLSRWSFWEYWSKWSYFPFPTNSWSDNPRCQEVLWHTACPSLINWNCLQLDPKCCTNSRHAWTGKYSFWGRWLNW